MSDSRYGVLIGSPAIARITGGTGAGMLVEWPESRLSKRITWKPRSASASQNS